MDYWVRNGKGIFLSTKLIEVADGPSHWPFILSIPRGCRNSQVPEVTQGKAEMEACQGLAKGWQAAGCGNWGFPFQFPGPSEVTISRGGACGPVKGTSPCLHREWLWPNQMLVQA